MNKRKVFKTILVMFLVFVISLAIVFVMLPPDHDLKWYQILLAAPFVGIVVYGLGYEVFLRSFIDWLKQEKKNKEWKKNNPEKKLRLLCLNCKYCKWYNYHPFYKHGPYRNVAVSKEPTYCRLLKIQLSGSNSRCKIPDNSNAFWEE